MDGYARRCAPGFEGDKRPSQHGRGSGGLIRGSMRTDPVKYSAGPFPEGCEPLRLISIIRQFKNALIKQGIAKVALLFALSADSPDGGKNTFLIDHCDKAVALTLLSLIGELQDQGAVVVAGEDIGRAAGNSDLLNMTYLTFYG